MHSSFILILSVVSLTAASAPIALPVDAAREEAPAFTVPEDVPAFVVSLSRPDSSEARPVLPTLPTLPALPSLYTSQPPLATSIPTLPTLPSLLTHHSAPQSAPPSPVIYSSIFQPPMNTSINAVDSIPKNHTTLLGISTPIVSALATASATNATTTSHSSVKTKISATASASQTVEPSSNGTSDRLIASGWVAAMLCFVAMLL